MEPIMKIYIKKGGVYRHNNRYQAFITYDIEHVEKGGEYYEYTLRLPDEEVIRIKKQGEVVDYKETSFQ